MIVAIALGNDPDGTVIMLDKICAISRIQEKPARGGKPVFGFMVSLAGGVNVEHETESLEQAQKDRQMLIQQYASIAMMESIAGITQ